MPSDLEKDFLSNLETVERAIAFACKRFAASADEREEFGSWAKLKLIEDDYAVLRKFRGKASLSTYLVAVIQNLFRDYRNREWGRWRPSAAAKRYGPGAVLLERMLSRDGMGLEESVETLVANHRVGESREELTALGVRLLEGRRFRVAHEEIAEVVPETSTEERLIDRERRDAIERTAAALRDSLRRLDEEDRLILKLRFEDGLPVSRIAVMLGLEQRPLYDRVARCLARLRAALEERDVDYATARSIAGWKGGELRLEAEGGESGIGPSNEAEMSIGGTAP